MKIYAYVNSHGYDLDDFIGEDLWVKSAGEDWSHTSYVRVVEKKAGRGMFDGRNVYVYNVAPWSAPLDATTDLLHSLLNETYVCPDYEMWAIHPIEVLSTDEIITTLSNGGYLL